MCRVSAGVCGCVRVCAGVHGTRDETRALRTDKIPVKRKCGKQILYNIFGTR